MSSSLLPPQSPGSAPSTRRSASGASARQAAVSAVTSYVSSVPSIDFVDTLPQDYYSSNVFTKSVMKDRLTEPIYKSLMGTIESGEKLDPEAADVVASAMRDWAVERGPPTMRMCSIR